MIANASLKKNGVASVEITIISSGEDQKIKQDAVLKECREPFALHYSHKAYPEYLSKSITNKLQLKTEF